MDVVLQARESNKSRQWRDTSYLAGSPGFGCDLVGLVAAANGGNQCHACATSVFKLHNALARAIANWRRHCQAAVIHLCCTHMLAQGASAVVVAAAVDSQLVAALAAVGIKVGRRKVDPGRCLD